VSDSRGNPGRRLAAVPAAAARTSDVDEIDEALDDLVTTVDDLVHDLDDAGTRPVVRVFAAAADPDRGRVVVGSARSLPAAPVHGRAFTIAVIAVLILFEFLVLMWLLSSP
jgi:tetrahydromethanopterin S-methyltransferase subunit B